MRSRLRLFLPLLLTLSLGALLWLGLGNNPYSQDEATLGRTLPAWQSDNLLDGSRIQTASLKGEPFVLNVWASWCVNCRAEHPLLSELAGTVSLYGLNYRDKGDAARAWLGGQITDAVAVTMMAERYQRLCSIWDGARGQRGMTA